MLEHAEIGQIGGAVSARLKDLKQRMQAGAPLPAWQGPRCEYCDMQGVCRQPLWHRSADG